MIKKIDHIGIAVRDIEQSLAVYRDLLGLEVKGIEEVAPQKVKAALLPVGESKVELLQATAEDATVARFIEKRGEGFHHVAFRVDNLEEQLERLKARGVQLVDEKPRPGAGGSKVAFLHPRSTGGVLVELCEHNHS